MKPSLRQVLANSHIAAIAILVLVLLLWSLESLFHGLVPPLYRTTQYLFTAVAIWGIPSSSGALTFADIIMLAMTFLYLLTALISFASAWILSRWVYESGPLRGLRQYYSKL